MNPCTSSSVLPASAMFAIALAPAVASAQHAPIKTTVLYTTIATDPSSSLPGDPGTPIDNLDIPFVSPDGTHWAISVNVDTGSTADDERLVVDGVVVIAEGSSPAYLPPGRALQRIDSKMGLLNSGAWAALADMDGSAADDDLVLVGDGLGGITIAAQEGSQIPGGPAGWVNGAMDGISLTGSGPSYLSSPVTGGPIVGEDTLAIVGGTILAQSGVDAPTGSVGGATQVWTDFEFGDFFVSSDGTNDLLEGDLAGPAEVVDVLVKNGEVLIQQGTDITYMFAGQTLTRTFNDIRSTFMSDSGDWIASGSFTNGVSWVAYNGVFFTTAGQPLVPGSTEFFTEIVDSVTCNSVGDYVIGGTTIEPSATDGVLLLNNERIVCREGDPLDLDGNGQFDDDVFIGQPVSNGTWLTDDLILYAVTRIQDGAGSDLGEALLTLDLNPVVGSVASYGCGVNPTGSLTVVSGTPAIGDTLVMGVDNPLGTQAPGSLAALSISGAADPNFPCGTVIPGLGMAGPYGPGELLIVYKSLLPLQTWNGSPTSFPLGIPADLALVGRHAYLQGVIIELTGQFALTEGADVTIGE